MYMYEINFRIDISFQTASSVPVIRITFVIMMTTTTKSAIKKIMLLTNNVVKYVFRFTPYYIGELKMTTPVDSCNKLNVKPIKSVLHRFQTNYIILCPVTPANENIF